MSLETAAYACLVGCFTAVPFSLPLGRALFCVALVRLIVHLVRTKQAPRIPVVGWLALAFGLVTIWATAFGLDARKGLKELDKLAWFIAIPVAATLVTSSRRLTRLLRGYGIGSVVLCGRLFAKSWEAGSQAIAEGRVDASWDAFRRGINRVPDVDHDFWWALMDATDITDAQLVMVGLVVSTGLIFIALRNRSQWGWWWVAALVLQLAALFLQFKRGSWLTATIVVLLLVLAKARWAERLFGPLRRLVARRWAIVVPVLAVILVGVALMPGVSTRLREAGDKVMERARTERPGKRLCMWLVITPSIVREHPGGIGWCVLSYDMMKQYCRHVEQRKTLHCNIAQILVATGWIGLTAYLLWMGKALIDAACYAARAKDRSSYTEVCAAVLLFMLLALMLNGLVECNLRKGDITLVYAITMGAATAGMIRLRDRSSGKNTAQSALPE